MKLIDNLRFVILDIGWSIFLVLAVSSGITLIEEKPPHLYVVTIKKDGNKQTINEETLKNATQREVTIADCLVHLDRFHIAFLFGILFIIIGALIHSNFLGAGLIGTGIITLLIGYSFRGGIMIEKLRFATLVGLIIFLILLSSLIFTRDQKNR